MDFSSIDTTIQLTKQALAVYKAAECLNLVSNLL
jgi:hypothetical protein